MIALVLADITRKLKTEDITRNQNVTSASDIWELRDNMVMSQLISYRTSIILPTDKISFNYFFKSKQ